MELLSFLLDFLDLRFYYATFGSNGSWIFEVSNVKNTFGATRGSLDLMDSGVLENLLDVLDHGSLEFQLKKSS